MTRIIITGPDHEGIGAALEDAGTTVHRIEAPVTAAALEEGQIADTDLFILTDPDEATAIPLVRERNQDIRIVVYTSTGLPEFASHQADLVIAPGAIDQSVIVEELLDERD